MLALALLVVGLHVMAHASPLWRYLLLVSVAGSVSVGSQVFGPANMKLLAEIVPEPERPRASGITLMIDQSVTVVGPALGSALFFALGIEGVLLTDILSFGASLLSLASLHHRHPAPHAETQRHLWAEWRTGARVFWRTMPLRVVALALACAMFDIGALGSLNIFFVTRGLHAPLVAYGWLTAAFSLGSLLGGGLGAWLVPRLGLVRAFGGSMVLVGAIIIAYAWLHSIGPAVVVYGIMGIPNAVNIVALGPLVLRETPPDFIGRIDSLLTAAWSSVYFISLLLCGALYSRFLYDIGGALISLFTMTGILVIIGGIFTLWSLRGEH